MATPSPDSLKVTGVEDQDVDKFIEAKVQEVLSKTQGGPARDPETGKFTTKTDPIKVPVFGIEYEFADTAALSKGLENYAETMRQEALKMVPKSAPVPTQAGPTFDQEEFAKKFLENSTSAFDYAMPHTGTGRAIQNLYAEVISLRREAEVNKFNGRNPDYPVGDPNVAQQVGDLAQRIGNGTVNADVLSAAWVTWKNMTGWQGRGQDNEKQQNQQHQSRVTPPPPTGSRTANDVPDYVSAAENMSLDQLQGLLKQLGQL